jgi:hypothetical protein
MNKDTFKQFTRGYFLFRAVDCLGPNTIATACIVISALGFCVAWYDHSYRSIISKPSMLLFFGIVSGLIALRWTRQQLPKAVEQVQPAFQSSEKIDKSIRTAVGRFPHWVISLMVAAAVAELLCKSVPRMVPLLTAFYIDGLCIIGGLVFGFGLPAWLWTYYLIWHIRCEDVELFGAHRLRWLSAYACTLGFIGIIPALILIGFYIQYRPNKWLLASAILQAAVAVILIVGTEAAIWSSLLTSRSTALDSISTMEVVLFRQLGTVEAENRKDTLDQLDKLEKIRQSISAIRGIHFVPWGDVCWKIFIPTIVGAAVFTYQLVMRINAKP